MAALVGIIILIIILGIMYMLGSSVALMALIGVIVGGILIGFGVHFVPVGGAPAAMGQAPGIATGVAMLAAVPVSPDSLVGPGLQSRGSQLQ